MHGSSKVLYQAHSVCGAEEEVIDDIIGNFIAVNSLYLYYSIFSTYRGFCKLIIFYHCFPFKVAIVCSLVEPLLIFCLRYLFVMYEIR